MISPILDSYQNPKKKKSCNAQMICANHLFVTDPFFCILYPFQKNFDISITFNIAQYTFMQTLVKSLIISYLLHMQTSYDDQIIQIIYIFFRILQKYRCIGKRNA